MIYIEAVNRLIKIGYDFKIDNSCNIIYDLVSTKSINEQEAAELFEQIKNHKQEAIRYLESVIKMTVNLKNGEVNEEYRFVVYDGTGKEIYNHTLYEKAVDKAAEYINKSFVMKGRFSNIAAFYSKATGLFRYYGVDVLRANRQDENYRQLNFLHTARVLTPNDPSYYNCPWDNLTENNL